MENEYGYAKVIQQHLYLLDKRPSGKEQQLSKLELDLNDVAKRLSSPPNHMGVWYVNGCEERTSTRESNFFMTILNDDPMSLFLIEDVIGAALGLGAINADKVKFVKTYLPLNIPEYEIPEFLMYEGEFSKPTEHICTGKWKSSWDFNEPILNGSFSLKAYDPHVKDLGKITNLFTKEQHQMMRERINGYVSRLIHQQEIKAAYEQEKLQK